MMDKPSSTRILRTKSDQLVEAISAAMGGGTRSSPISGEAAGGGAETLSRKSSRRLTLASPGRSEKNNTHIRKSRSAQLKYDLDEVSSGAALSRASSASLGLSFSFTGFTVPPDEIADIKPFSDDDIPEDLEAGTRKMKIQAEPTLPIYLKAKDGGLFTMRPFEHWQIMYDIRLSLVQNLISCGICVQDFPNNITRSFVPKNFTEVCYKVVLKGVTSTTEKEILSGISGSVDPGEVLALMGPSGSGKTTLLSLLGGRIKEPTGGSITYNEQPYSKLLKSRQILQKECIFGGSDTSAPVFFKSPSNTASKWIGFVTQDDILFPHLTVRETLTYAARLRLPKKLTKEEKEKRAIAVIYELGLERCQDTMIGGSFVRGVSGGERKRVCIGNEIIINPSLLFLDEPTSGLDSTTALRIVEILQDIAEAGKTVITTIHQPSSRLFHKFDKLILLGKGSLLYFGKASEAMIYFSTIGCSPLISMNPAEFLLDLANGNLNDVSVPSELEDRVQTGNSDRETRNGKPSPAIVHEYLVEAYEMRVSENEKKKLMAPMMIDEELKSKVFNAKREWGASWCEQYSILFWRGLKERRHDYFSWLKITQVVATAVILGLLWWQSGGDSPKHMQEQAGLLFFIAVFWGFFPVFTAIFTFPQERAMLNKERSADMYRLSAYFLSRTSSDIPLDLILPVLFILVVYFMAGLKHDACAFFLTVLTTFLCIVAAQGLGLAIGATLMDLKRATTLASVTVMTFMLAGGYFVKKVPIFISWLRYLSYNYQTYKLLLKVQYKEKNDWVDGIKVGTGVKEVCTLLAMVFGYRLLAYISLRRMKLHSGT